MCRLDNGNFNQQGDTYLPLHTTARLNGYIRCLHDRPTEVDFELNQERFRQRIHMLNSIER